MDLQGKLVLSFMAVLVAALGASGWMFYSHNRTRLADVTGAEARQLSLALALGAEDEVRTGRVAQLRDTAQELVKSRNVLFVAFLDPNGHPVAFASRDPDYYVQRGDFVRTDAAELMRVRKRRSTLFGDYVEVVAPMLTTSQASATASADDGAGGGGGSSAGRLGGYVAVGVSQAGEAAQLRRTLLSVLGIGCVMLMLSFPLSYAMVHLTVTPIRELVRVTKKITGGDLDARVEVSRTDVIGELARSFNEMVIWVKKQQQDVAAANRDLEAKVALRTSQLETAMQQLSSEIAEKEDFLRAVSHDLNAPLRNISGMATMLLMKYREKFDEDVMHRLERIKKNVDVETDLIAELLELSRIKTRRQKMEPVDVEQLVWELRGVFENDLRHRAIQLIVDTSLPMLEAERARVRQIFQNLVDNAIKYMGEGATREIHVGCTIRVNEAEFYVRDTGIGIDPDDLDKVFYVFRRGKSSAVQNTQGKGVGLASVKSIVETYNGKIWVESKPGEGTTFRFTINGKHVPASQRALEHAASRPLGEQGGAELPPEQPESLRLSPRADPGATTTPPPGATVAGAEAGAEAGADDGETLGTASTDSHEPALG